MSKDKRIFDLEERLIDELISIFMASIKTAKQNKGKPS
jgi:hypothetical protein